MSRDLLLKFIFLPVLHPVSHSSVIFNDEMVVVYQELTGELSKLKLRETDLKLTSEPPLLLDTENNEMHKVE